MPADMENTHWITNVNSHIYLDLYKLNLEIEYIMKNQSVMDLKMITTYGQFDFSKSSMSL